jgi:excinuclease ABC subunit A
LNVGYRQRSIAQCLARPIEEARSFFRGELKLQRKLGRLAELGLGYIPLGQRLSTLSAGELQRLKLANLLMDKKPSTLFVMDEPTTGLHFSDIERLIQLLRSMIRDGHTIVVVEHNLQVIEAADHVIELGPGPGELGGRLVACGTPMTLSQNPTSLIGSYLFRPTLPVLAEAVT